MPRGCHTGKRPSGFQQRKAKIAKLEARNSVAGSMLKYVSKTANDQCMHDADHVSSDTDGEDNTSTNVSPVCAQNMDNTFDSKDDREHSSTLVDTEKPVQLDVMSDVSVWNMPLSDNLRLAIIEQGSAPYQNKDGPFKSVSRQLTNDSKGHVRQLTKEWFYKVMPNEEKILRSWMVYSLKTDQLYCFCCQLFATDITMTSSKFISGFSGRN